MHSTNRFIIILVTLLLGLFSLQSTALAQSDPILTYRATHDLLPEDDVHWVEVYEDGMTLVHYPAYMKKAGDYAVQLSPPEVQQIRLALEHPLIQGFDHGQVKAEKKNIDAQSSELFEISDNSYAEFEFNVQGQPTARRHIRWANLRIDAERYPEIGILRKLYEIEASLLELDEHPTAERLD